MKSQINLDDKKFEIFFDRIGFTFKDKRLLLRALTHRSYLNEHPEAVEDNERLEFLGDAVLDFLVGDWVYHNFPEMDEGELTRLRSAFVRTEQLAQFSELLGLDEMMLLGRGEVEVGGRKRPALLCATFEAMVGAMCLDAEIYSVKKFIDPLLSQTAELILNERKDQDPKSLLQEWAQSQGYGTPVYRTTATYGPEHEKYFVIEVLINNSLFGVGEGRSKQLATKNAAANALLTLDIN